MKIIKIEFENINSLAGHWKIDFTAQEFQPGMFLLSGPTGSGKSSVLDAVTLALYGRTVRQSKINGNVNEVMTRGEKSCFAEVEFESCGNAYRVRWSQRRKQPKAIAERTTNIQKWKLDKAIHTLFNVTQGKDISAHKGADFLDDVANAVGLTYDEFTRTVLLAQGQFNNFLSAKDEDRAAILERATGTGQFSRIGQAIFARWRTEDAKLEKCRETLAGIASMSPEEKAAVEKDAAAKTDESNALDAGLKTLRADETWSLQDAELKKAVEKVAREKGELAEKKAAFIPVKAKRDSALKARKLDGEEKNRRIAVDAKTKADAELHDRQETEKAAAERLVETTRAAAAAKEADARTKKAYEEIKPLIEKARSLDQAIGLAEEKHKGCQGMLTQAKKNQKKAKDNLARNQLDAGTAERLAKAARELLENGLPPPEEFRNDELMAAVAQARASEELIAKAKLKADAATEKADAAKAAYEAADAKHDAAAPGLKEAVNTAKALLDFAKSALTLDDRRKELEDGKPCPLCGATHHPWALANAAIPAKRQAEKGLAAAEKAQDDAEEALTKARDARDKAAATAQREETAEHAAETDAATARREASNGLASIEARCKTLRESGPALERAVAEAETSLAKAAAEEKAAAKELAVKQKERLSVAMEDPQKTETDFSRKVSQKEKALFAAEKKNAEAATAAEKAEQERVKAAQAAETARAAVIAAESLFAEKRAAAGFADETAWQSARWNDDEIEAADHQEKELAESETRLKTLEESNTEKERAQTLLPHTGRLAEEIHREIEEKEAKKSAADKAIGEAKQKLAADSAQCERKGKAQEALAAQETVSRKWSNLNAWLGGEDGRAFRRYAQGVTLRELLKKANPHLLEMSRGRYELRWSVEDKNPGGNVDFLMPDVVDRDRNDAVRPVSNMSGGETFQLSLALALGLSGMSVKGLTVGTMFLDEGFGTLDGDCLEQALQTLVGLHENGRLIGVITHVEAVKEKIGTRIDVVKTGRGVSTLSGPGVTNMAKKDDPGDGKP